MMYARTGILLVAALVAGACARNTNAGLPPESAVRQAPGAPSRFDFDGSAFDPDSVPGRNACRTPMMDPRDGTRLHLVRTKKNDYGDYEVPEGHYGVGPNELLRLSCRTGGLLGIVPR